MRFQERTYVDIVITKEELFEYLKVALTSIRSGDKILYLIEDPEDTSNYVIRILKSDASLS